MHELVALVCAVCWGCGSGDDDTTADVPDAADVSDVAEAADADADADADGAADADADADADGVAADDGGAEAVIGNVPICEGGTGSGTRRRWVDPVSGYEYCEAPCRDCTAECRSDGTADEGWYAACSGTTEAGCGALPGLITRTNCM